jgi:hypothetical protein
MRRGRATILQWKSKEYYTNYVCICGLRYPACNVHAPYFYLWPSTLYNNFSHYLKTARFSKKKLEHKMCVLIFLCNFFLKHFSFEEQMSEIRSKMYILV